MQSKISYFNKTLFRKNLTRFWPLWGGASLAGVLAPMTMLVALLKNDRYFGGYDAALQMTSIYYAVVCWMVPILSLLYAILCAMAVWNYLFNARSVSLMHTLPITRKGLFTTSFLSGMAMMLIPYAVVGGLLVVISLASGTFEPVGVLVTTLGVLGETLFYFAAATAVVFVTGNPFAFAAFYFIFQFLGFFAEWLITMLMNMFYFGVDETYRGVASFLSPTIHLVDHVGVHGQYEQIVTADGWIEYGDLLWVKLANGWLIAVYALVGVVLLGCAWALYRRRRSECAGDVVAVGWMRPFFRYGLAGLAALLGGQLIYSLFWDDRYFKVVPLAVCMLVAGVIGYYAASMLLAKTLRVFRGSWRGLVLVAAGIVVVCGCLRLDLFRAADRVPEIGQVQKVELYVDSNTYVFYPGEEDELLERVRTLHAAIAADRDYIQAFDREARTAELDMSAPIHSYYATFTYTTRGGQTVRRSYQLPLTRERLGQSGTYDNLLDSLINSQEMRLKRLHASGDGYKPTGGSIYFNKRGEGCELSDREAAAILEAVTRDAQAGRWGHVDWLSTKAWNSGTYALQLSLEFSRESDQGWDWIDIAVRPEMTATTACLLELGLAGNEDLVTQGELYPEEYEDVAYPAPTGEVVYPDTAFHAAVVTGVVG